MSLNPSVVYILNTRLRTILGFYNNIMYNNMANDVDRIRLKRLCSQFLEKTPLFSETFIPVMYVDLLLDTSSVSRLVVDLFKEKRDKRKQNFAQKFRELVKQKDSNSQNEGALYAHFCQFVLETPPHQLTDVKNAPFFGQLDGSLMRVMDKELLSLKATPGLANTGNFAETWKKIIDLESTATSFQLCTAACSHYNAGSNATDCALKFECFAKSAKYFEESLKAIEAVGLEPPASNYGGMATACFNAASNTTDPVLNFKYFAKSTKHFEEQLNALKREGCNPTADDYGNIAGAYFHAGSNASDPVVRFEYFTESAKYYKERLMAIKAADLKPTADDYSPIVVTYATAGEFAANLVIQLEYLKKSAKNIEKMLKAIEAVGDGSTKARDIGDVYFQAVEDTTDPMVKFECYSSAKKCFEFALKEEIQGDDAQEVTKCLAQISTYFGELEKAAHSDKPDDMQCDG